MDELVICKYNAFRLVHELQVLKHLEMCADQPTDIALVRLKEFTT